MTRKNLLSMSEADFSRIVLDSGVPPTLMPPPLAPRDQRVDALLEWLESR